MVGIASPYHVPPWSDKEAKDGGSLGEGVANEHRPIALLSVVDSSNPQLGSP